MKGPTTLCRAVCTRCLRPQTTCLCALAQPTTHRTQVLVLQHPQEQRQAKNSVALLSLSLAQCDVVVGERFSPEALQALLQRPGRDTWLLYPDVPTSLAPSGPGTPAGAALRLVVLDATWAIVEFIQFLRKRPFPQRMRAGAYWG